MTRSSSVIGLGTAAIGRPQYINIRQDKPEAFSLDAFREKGRQVLELAYARGVRYFDTAPGYGLAEELVMDWAAGKNDPSIEIATKWGYTYVANFDPEAAVHEVKEHSLAKLNEQWQESQRMLPMLTTYQIHSATFETGVLKNEDILNRLAALKEEKELLIGITTTGDNQVEVLKKAMEVEIEGKALFDVFQVTYNLLDQSFAEIAGILLAENRRIIVKEALANGRVFPNKVYPSYSDFYEKLGTLAAKYETEIDAIALRFCMDSINSSKVLSGAANKFHLTENLKAMQFELEEEDLMKMKEMAISPVQYWGERKQLGWN